MAIYKRGRIWWIDFYDQNRNRVQESTHSSNRRDAEHLYALRRSEVLRNVYRPPTQISLEDFGKRYMEHAKANKRSWLRDQQMLQHMQNFFGQARLLSEIRPSDIEDYKLHRRKEVSGSTVNRELALLKRMFNLAQAWDLFQELNPVKKVKFFREFNTGLRVVSPEEEEKIIRHAAPYVQDLVRFALNTGLRVGEIFSLRWSNVDLKRKLISVFAPKTSKVREVPLSEDGFKVLQAWWMGKKSEFVFYNPDTGKPFVDLKAGLSVACRKAGVNGVSWHTLRHTLASRLVNRGVDIVTVKELLGHSSITVTMRYAHTNLAAKRAAVEALNFRSDNLVTVPTSPAHSGRNLSLQQAVSYA
jgi:integrase